MLSLSKTVPDSLLPGSIVLYMLVIVPVAPPPPAAPRRESAAALWVQRSSSLEQLMALRIKDINIAKMSMSQLPICRKQYQVKSQECLCTTINEVTADKCRMIFTSGLQCHSLPVDGSTLDSVYPVVHWYGLGTHTIAHCTAQPGIHWTEASATSLQICK